MTSIDKDVRGRTITIPFADEPKNHKLLNKYTRHQQERFEKALNCVENNAKNRGRNQRDWNAFCLKINTGALGHSMVWNGIAMGTSAAGTAAKPGVPPQAVAATAAVWGLVGAAVGLGQAITDTDTVTRIDPSDCFSENPLKKSD